MEAIKIVKHGEGKAVSAAGDKYNFLIEGHETDNTYALFHGLVPPGAGPPLHRHNREFEAFYVLEGELTYFTQDKRITAGPGTYIHIPRGVLHTFKNESSADARMLAIVAPAGFDKFIQEIGHPLTDKDARPLAMTPEDVERILSVAPKYGVDIVLPNEKTDFSGRDDEAQATFYVLLWKRKGITLEMFDDYWRDVHGPVCARLPGQFQYWQFHVDHNQGGVFPVGDGVESISGDEDQFDGIAELTFQSLQDRQTWFDAAEVLMDDEHNIFSKAIGYVTELSHSKTYVDHIEMGDPNGNLKIVKFHVMVRQASGVSVSDFRRYLTDQFAKHVTESDKVLKFRLHLFEPPDVSRPDAAGVSHSEPLEQQYQAAFEIAFEDHLDMEDFFVSEEYEAAVKDQATFVKALFPFPERDPYTFVYNGKMTLAGQRGSRTAQLVANIGSTNQLQGDILDLMLGNESRTPVSAGKLAELSRASDTPKRNAMATLSQLFTSSFR